MYFEEKAKYGEVTHVKLLVVIIVEHMVYNHYLWKVPQTTIQLIPLCITQYL